MPEKDIVQHGRFQPFSLQDKGIFILAEKVRQNENLTRLLAFYDSKQNLRRKTGCPDGENKKF